MLEFQHLTNMADPRIFVEFIRLATDTQKSYQGKCYFSLTSSDQHVINATDQCKFLQVINMIKVLLVL